MSPSHTAGRPGQSPLRTVAIMAGSLFLSAGTILMIYGSLLTTPTYP